MKISVADGTWNGNYVVLHEAKCYAVTCVDDFYAISLVPNSQTYLNHGYR